MRRWLRRWVEITGKTPPSGLPLNRVAAARVVAAVFTVGAVFMVPLVGGCASGPPTTQPMSEDEKQDAILNDPMNYKPQIDRSVTGSDNDSTHFGHGLGSDVNDVLNP